MKTDLLRVLLVEDNPGDARLIREYLDGGSEERVRLEWFDRLTPALETVRGDGLDAALLDLNLPETRGLETLKRVREASPDLPIVVLTGLSDEQTALEALAAGAQDYLVKGEANTEAIFRSLRYARERKRHQEELQRANELLRIRSRISEIFLTREGDDLFGEVMDEVVKLTRSGLGFLAYLDPEDNLVFLAMSEGVWERCSMGEEDERTLFFTPSEWEGTAWGDALVQRRQRVLEKASDRTPTGHVTIERAVITPLVTGGEAIGVMTLANRATEYDPEILEACEVMSQHLAPILQARLERDLHERERRRAEEELRELALSLEERVRDRTEELEAFTYSVSHDLRGPLRAIDGFSRILVDEKEEDLGEEGRRLLGVVRENASLMATLIDDLLEFSRAGRRKMTTCFIDTKDMVEEVVRKLRVEHPEWRPEIEMGELPPAEGDPSLLRQVWMNLLSNAAKFSGEAAEPRIRIEGSLHGSEVRYIVSDNGVGFEAEYADKLFKVFERLHGRDEFSGTGVGLALVHRIVERHGGWIRGESEKGAGATFTFALPLSTGSGE
jgi:signal transduction histidine kinase/DNA-binding response OmpR family regulator